MILKMVLPLFILTGSILVGIFYPENPAEAEKLSLLPEVSAKGANTFGCMVNNEPWVSHQVQANLHFFERSVCLSLRTGSGLEDRLAFIIQKTNLKPGTYLLDNPTSDYIHLQRTRSECLYTSDEFYQAVLTIHENDTSRKILAGTFEFLAFSQSCTAAIRGTHGRFDVCYSEH